ncbi:GvpT/GvpP family gas vesicle accessory protein [Bacillus gobiensis]|uniref:GvpT/GvpP family gas vesicle accessory protein n=1 Tax=Bacillus gobiensis TaxID=1441095 RepID=UPI003D24B77B
MTIENKVEGNENRENKLTSSPVKRTILYGVAGATIGLVTSKKAGKRILAAVDTEKLKEKSLSFGKSAKEKLGVLKDSSVEKSQKAAKEIKNKTTNFITKRKNNEEAETQSNQTEPESKNDHSDNEQYEALKEQNKKLSERLEQVEQKLKQLSESTESDSGSKTYEAQTSVSNNDDTSSK